MRANIIGKQYNKLTVIKEVEYITKISKKKQVRFLCICSCDNKTKIITTSYRLKIGETKSCGCIKSEVGKKNIINAYKSKTKYSPKEATAKSIYNKSYKNDNLSFSEFMILSQMPCYYCNSPPSNSAVSFVKASSQYYKNNCRFLYNGLDRVDSKKSHSKDNVVPCCFQCNAAKSNMTLNDFIVWITNLCSFNK